jgi:hypothetical protein
MQIEPGNAAAQQMRDMLHPGEKKPAAESEQRQVRIDPSESQQSHLTGAPTRFPLPHASRSTRLPHQR